MNTNIIEKIRKQFIYDVDIIWSLRPYDPHVLLFYIDETNNPIAVFHIKSKYNTPIATDTAVLVSVDRSRLHVFGTYDTGREMVLYQLSKTGVPSAVSRHTQRLRSGVAYSQDELDAAEAVITKKTPLCDVIEFYAIAMTLDTDFQDYYHNKYLVNSAMYVTPHTA